MMLLFHEVLRGEGRVEVPVPVLIPARLALLGFFRVLVH